MLYPVYSKWVSMYEGVKWKYLGEIPKVRLNLKQSICTSWKNATLYSSFLDFPFMHF